MTLKRADIKWAVNDAEWQSFRKSLRGLPLATKLQRLNEWLVYQKYSHRAKIQVENYINALKRAGYKV